MEWFEYLYDEKEIKKGKNHHNYYLYGVAEAYSEANNQFG